MARCVTPSRSVRICDKCGRRLVYVINGDTSKKYIEEGEGEGRERNGRISKRVTENVLAIFEENMLYEYMYGELDEKDDKEQEKKKEGSEVEKK